MRSSPKSKVKPFSVVPKFYYKIGLFCSSHPHAILLITTLIIIASCYPLLHLPLPGSKPQEFFIQNTLYNGTEDPTWPRWLIKNPTPVVYIQQIVVKSYINQNSGDPELNDDVFRGIFRHVFRIVDKIRTVPNLEKNCFHVHEVKPRILKEESMLPEHECLIVSPANFWQGKIERFEKDPDIVGTMLNYQSHEKGKSGLAEIFLGMNVKETGLKIYPFQRTPGSRNLMYAVTIVLQQLDQDFHLSLKSKLSDYKLKTSNKTSFIYYPPNTSYFELIPLLSTYILLFIYIYFSVKKIEIIRSKLGVAFSALLTIIASLCMSVGLCSSFGMMNFEVSGKTIFPYLIGIVGLENVLVMTRSVVSTNVNLDVKIRLAQGLSKEGWSITKNLLTEVTILTIGFFTFFPRIQEFCILAILGLLSDFFLQTFFFGTILSLDIRRIENPTHHYTQPLRTPISNPKIQQQNPQQNHSSNSPLLTPPSSPLNNHNPGVVVAPSASPYITKIPKRLQLVYFWAKTRFFQRTFMIFMVGWISVIIYELSVGFLESEFEIVLPPVKLQQQQQQQQEHFQQPNPNILSEFNPNNINVTNINFNSIQFNMFKNYNNNLTLPRNVEGTMITRSNHWQSLISIYNVSLTGKYIRALPTINLLLSHSFFGSDKKFNWEALSSPFGTDGFDEIPSTVTKKALYTFDDPYVPTSPVELALTILLAIPSLIFMCYSMVVFYRCICSRNYAEWRSSWNSNHDKSKEDCYTQVVFEALPLVLTGHVQEVECLGCDGNTIASVCLNGVLNVWNVNAENIASVDRKRYFEGTTDTETDSNDEENEKTGRKDKEGKMSKQPVWCLDIMHRIIALGTGTGRLEIWDAYTGALRAIFDEGAKSGIMCVKIVGARVVVARLNGSLDFIQLESSDGSSNSLKNHQQHQSNPYHRWSSDVTENSRVGNPSVVEGEIRCVWLTTVRAHQQPVTVLEAEGNIIVTGSQDHCLKVFKVQDNTHLYTLHGHYGPITSLFIDKDFKESPITSGSGSQDGMLCVWDLQTGMCMYSIQAHDGPVTGLTYSTSYIISIGGDDKILVWERFQGHLLNTIQLDHAYCSSLVMLTYNLLITSKQGSLIVWDVQSGQPVRAVKLGHRDNTVFVRQIINCGGAVLCDYGSQLRLVRFPSLGSNKLE